MSTKLGKHCIGKSYAGLHRNNFIKERLQHRCFPVNNAKFLRTPILKSICERLLLLIVIFSQENNRIQRCLDMPEPKLHKKLTFVMLVHSPQTAFHRKMIYNFVWIYLGRSSRPEVFCKKSVLRILQNSQENICVSLIFNKITGLRPVTLFKKRLWYRCFSVKFVKFLRTPFLTEHFRWLLLSWPTLPKKITCGMLAYG